MTAFFTAAFFTAAFFTAAFCIAFVAVSFASTLVDETTGVRAALTFLEPLDFITGLGSLSARAAPLFVTGLSFNVDFTDCARAGAFATPLPLAAFAGAVATAAGTDTGALSDSLATADTFGVFGAFNFVARADWMLRDAGFAAMFCAGPAATGAMDAAAAAFATPTAKLSSA